MVWKTEPEFENEDKIVRAVYSPESQSVYYIIDNSKDELFSFEGYTVAYYPNRRKEIETISLLDTKATLSEAVDILEEKTEDGIFDVIREDYSST